MPRKLALPAILLSCSIPLATIVCSTLGQERSVRMKIAGIRGNRVNGQVIVILKEEDGLRILPIVVGDDQALSIHLGYEGLPSPRPLTHDLMVQMLKAMETHIEKVVITDLREGTYYAEVVLQHAQQTHKIDARPSDAIALALRVDAPIFCCTGLLQQEAVEERDTDLPPQTVAHGWGFVVQNLTPSLAEFFGRREVVLVADVRPDSPAEQAGLRAGDVIVRLQNSEISNMKDFAKQLAAQRDQEELGIKYLRDNEIQQITLSK